MVPSRASYPLTTIYKNTLLVYINMLLRIDCDFKKTTTAHCSVPMLKRPSYEAGPSH